VRNSDPFKAKQLDKGLLHLTDEGLAQLFVQNPGQRKIIGVVGTLQFDVIKYRLLNEFGASCNFSPVNGYRAVWVRYNKKEDIEDLTDFRYHSLFQDKNDNLVFIPESRFTLQMAKEKNPNAEFLDSMEHNDQTLELEAS